MFLRFKKPAVNRWRGEVAARVNNEWTVLRLDLDALARLENIVSDSNLLTFLDRITTHGLRVDDVGHVLSVVLHDRGFASDRPSPKTGVHINGGYMTAHKLAVDLLHAAFFLPTSDPENNSTHGDKDYDSKS